MTQYDELRCYTCCCKKGILSRNLHVQHVISEPENEIRITKFAYQHSMKKKK
ncbi:unnamed protein product, partial [Plutella xylostella]